MKTILKMPKLFKKLFLLSHICSAVQTSLFCIINKRFSLLGKDVPRASGLYTLFTIAQRKISLAAILEDIEDL